VRDQSELALYRSPTWNKTNPKRTPLPAIYAAAVVVFSPRRAQPKPAKAVCPQDTKSTAVIFAVALGVL